jgi:membrane protease YdiL (CAAX protease family)
MLAIFKNRYGELRSGWSIIMALALLLIGQMTARALVPEGSEDDIAVKIIVTLVYGIIAVAGVLLLFKLVYKRPLRQMGMIREGWFAGVLHGFGIGAFFSIVIFLTLIHTRQTQISGINIHKLLSLSIVIELMSVCVFMFSEELVARGYIMTALKTTRNKWVILLSSSVLFGVLHLINPGATVVSITTVSLGGLLIAYMFVKSGKIWLPTGFHIGLNYISGDILGMSVTGDVHAPEASVLQTSIVGSNVFFTGGASGPTSSLYMLVLVLLGLVYVHFVVKTPSGSVWTMESDLPLTRS